MEPLELTESGQIRINKYLAEQGVCSRREADRLIAAGLVKINGVKATVGSKVGPADRVSVKGKGLGHEKPKPLYIAFNKPVGIISTGDKKAINNVYEYLKIKERVFHVGRLDVASSGLMLFTNDGEAAYKIMRAEANHEKEYIVAVDKTLTDEMLKALATGIVILGRKTKPAKITKIDEKTFNIILTEGRNRQIRRMCEELKLEVKSLKRIRVMNVELGKLPAGKWRELTDQERTKLLAAL
jgi:23S rRNA pseudouridine2604 synthase